MSNLFDFIFYVFSKLINWLGSTVIGDLGFSIGSIIVVFFVIGLLITFLIPGVTSASSSLRNSR